MSIPLALHSGDRNFRANEGRLGSGPVNPAGSFDRGEDSIGDTKIIQNLPIPAKLMDVVQHGPGGVRVVRNMKSLARQIVDQPAVHRAARQLSSFSRPADGFLMVQDPINLGGRKIGIDHQARFTADLSGPGCLFNFRTARSRSAALPDDSIIHRAAALPVPD